MSIRRILALLLGTMIAFGGVSLVAGSADAKTGCPRDKGNNHGNQYPPGQCKAGVSSSVVMQGQTVTVFGDGFQPGTTVLFELSPGVFLGSAVADSTGHVSLLVRIPQNAALGRHVISLSGAGGRFLTTSIEVIASTRGDVVTSGNQSTGQSGQSATQSGTSSGGLATTGAGDLVPLVGGGAALVALGAMTLLIVRRRREDPVPS